MYSPFKLNYHKLIVRHPPTRWILKTSIIVSLTSDVRIFTHEYLSTIIRNPILFHAKNKV